MSPVVRRHHLHACDGEEKHVSEEAFAASGGCNLDLYRSMGPLLGLPALGTSRRTTAAVLRSILPSGCAPDAAPNFRFGQNPLVWITASVCVGPMQKRKNG